MSVMVDFLISVKVIEFCVALQNVTCQHGNVESNEAVMLLTSLPLKMLKTIISREKANIYNFKTCH